MDQSSYPVILIVDQSSYPVILIVDQSSYPVILIAIQSNYPVILIADQYRYKVILIVNFTGQKHIYYFSICVRDYHLFGVLFFLVVLWLDLSSWFSCCFVFCGAVLVLRINCSKSESWSSSLESAICNSLRGLVSALTCLVAFCFVFFVA